MSAQMKLNLKVLALIGSIIGSVILVVKAGAGVAEPYMVMPQRVEHLEKKVEKIQARSDVDHDVLQRIDERTGLILDRMTNGQPVR